MTNPLINGLIDQATGGLSNIVTDGFTALSAMVTIIIIVGALTALLAIFTKVIQRKEDDKILRGVSTEEWGDFMSKKERRSKREAMERRYSRTR